jgi:putative heme-binding domain-containing protein
MWVATSPIYPQIRPGAKPVDQILVLEDTNQDGVADKRTVFADGLLIPTAVLPDEEGGAFVANSTELLHLSDRDGDGVADERHVVLSSFGTEDTHHILHTFRWSPDALLCLNQSIYIHTHAETPYGVQRLSGSGIWRYRPQTARANVIAYGMVNPWGHVYDDWGQEFATDGAGNQGINYVFPGAAFETAVGFDRVLPGLNPGQPKHCGLEIVSGRHFPDDWQGQLIAADFRGNRINRFQLSPQGSGYTSKQLDDLLTCQDRAFRPVDVKMGPDGALYVADWHDSIINHGEVDFRDPRRDVSHGRIWRVSCAGRPVAPPPRLADASLEELLEQLRAPEQRTRMLARVLLTRRDRAQALAALAKWTAALNPQEPDFERLRLEALWVGQGLGQVSPELLSAVLTSTDHRARAAGVRCLSQSASEAYGLPVGWDVLAALEKAVADPHPQMRLEAVNALRDTHGLKAAELAIRTLDADKDSWTDYALWRTIRVLQADWLPAALAGQAEFCGNVDKLLFALVAIDNSASVPTLLKLLADEQLSDKNLTQALELIGKYANADELRVLYDRALARPQDAGPLLQALVAAGEKRHVSPSGDLAGIPKLLERPAALQLAGLWNQEALRPRVIEVAEDLQAPKDRRRFAILGLSAFGDDFTLGRLAARTEDSSEIRRWAISGLLPVSAPKAAAAAAALLAAYGDGQAEQSPALLDVFLSAKEGPQGLADALQNVKLKEGVATAAVRHASTVGKRADPLLGALRTAGGIKTLSGRLSPEEMTNLSVHAVQTGNAARGERIYRRRELNCQTCHSVGGAGGQVGPDMLSLGASSPIEYIVESLLVPSAKIKEGFHALTVTTVDGKIFTGLLVREGADTLVLRNAQGVETSIPKADIEERAMSMTSLMPADLTAKLPRDEFIDLVRFLNMLGKDGPYKVPANRFVRRWIASDEQPLFSRVDGALPLEDVPGGRIVSFEIDVSAPGSVALQLNSPEGLRVTRGAQTDNLRAEKILLDLPVGRHRFTIEKNGPRSKPLSVEVVDVPGSAGHAEPANR